MSILFYNVEPIDHTSGEYSWPVRRPQDKARLADLCALFGWRLEPAAGRSHTIAPRDGIVVALGQEVAGVAKLYARLTGRECMACETIRELKQISRVQVVVALHSKLNSEIFFLGNDNTLSIPGVITAEDVYALESVALKYSAALLMGSSAARLPFIDIDMFVPVGRHSIGERTLLGNKSSVTDLSSALSDGASVIAVSAHSDGVDADLVDLIICTQKSRDTPHLNTATCAKRNFCHRLRIPLAAALADMKLFPISSIRAQAACMLSCFGLMLPQAGMAFSDTICGEMNLSGTIGGIITTLGVGLASTADHRRLLDFLEAGHSLSRACHEFYSEDASRIATLPLCIIGDPDFARMDAVTRLEQPRFEKTRMPLPTYGRSFPAFLIEASSQLDDGSRSQILSLALQRWESGGINSQIDKGHDTLTAAILSFGTMPSRQWMRTTSAPKLIDHSLSKCHVCGNLLNDIVFTPARDLQRRVLVCPVCGVLLDEPAINWEHVRFNHSGGIYCLDVCGISDVWSGYLVFERSKDRYSETIAWPSDKEGKPQSTFQPAITLLPGINIAALIFVTNGDFSITRFPVYA